MPAPLVWAAWVAATAGTAYLATVLAPVLEEDDPYDFPDDAELHPHDAPEYTQRLINPLWAPTAYLQGIDCLKSEYEVKSLDGELHGFEEYTVEDEELVAAARDSSLSYSVHVNEDGHAILLLKALSLPQENDKHEDGPSSTLKDTLGRDEQLPVLDRLARHLLDDPRINTIETVGFAQGSEGVYYLAENYHIIGTNISDTGTDFTSEHLGRYVVSLDVPGDIHNGFGLTSTGEHTPGYEIDLGEAVDFSFAPTPTSWVEKIQTLAFQFGEADAPEGYEDQGIKLVDDALGADEGVCNNPTMIPGVPTGGTGSP